MSLLLAGALLIPGCGPSKKPGGPRALYMVKKAAAAPVIDGVLEDACWKDLPALEFVLLDVGGKPKQPTSVRMTYDNRNLYVGFECQDLDAASTVAEFDGPVLTDGDFVSLLIQAGSDTTTYFLIAAAPTGAVEDAFVLNGGNSARLRILTGWNCERLGVSVAVYGAGAQPGNADRFWTVEMAIPFSELVTAPHIPPIPGDTWRMNLCRLERAGARESSAISPTGTEDIQKPRSFALISFGG